jgi:excinuclease ABC subunit A
MDGIPHIFFVMPVPRRVEHLIPDKTRTLLEVYESLKVTTGFLRILKKKYDMYFGTPFWQLPEDIRDEVVYGTYDNGKQSYCIERILKNSYKRSFSSW